MGDTSDESDTNDVESYSYAGCYDNVLNKLLNDGPHRGNPMSAEICYKVCTERQFRNNFNYFGTQKKDTCFCGKIVDIEAYNLSGYKRNTSECSSNCKGGDDEKCGSKFNVSLYKLKVQSIRPSTKMTTTSVFQPAISKFPRDDPGYITSSTSERGKETKTPTKGLPTHPGNNATLAANVTTTATVLSAINSKESDSPAGIPVYAVIALYTIVFAIVAGIVIIIKRCRKHRANNSKPSGTPLNIIVTETIESSDCSNINNDKRTGVDIQKIKNTHDIETSIEQEDSICNKYESLSTNRNSVQHIYELYSTHTNQYESLTKQRESDKHTYESTEHASLLDIKTSTPYQSLNNPPESDKHVYASTHTNQYESLSKQRESDKHTYESTEQTLPVSMEQELSQYQSLTNPPESDKHVNASTHTNQYESLSKQRESDKNTYESTEQALPVSMEQELSQYQSLTNPPESDKHVYASTQTNQYESSTKQRESDKHTYESTEHASQLDIKTSTPYQSLNNPPESDKHVYASTHTNQYESLSKQRESDKHTYESTEQALPVSMEQELSQYQSLTNPPESDKHVYASTHTNQYESLSKQRESDKHTYESTEQALPVSMEQELSQYQSLTNPPESDKHVYASTHTNRYELLSKQRESDKHTYESTDHALPVSKEQELSSYQSLTNPPESDKQVYASTAS